ncbi:MAG: zinc-ribbon domain-containing protein [Syntrophobacteraceae bacterium]
MIVACESCKTKFRLDPERIKSARKRVRCSKCGHVFEVFPPDQDEEELFHVELSDEPMGESEEEEQQVIIPARMSPEPSAPVPKRRGPSKSVMIGMGCAAILVIVLTYVLISRPPTPPPAPVPTAKAPAGEMAQPDINILDTTQAYFLENAHAGQIFVVEGEVANESSQPVSFILLEGKLFTKNNQVAVSQRCYAGNPMPRSELTKINVTDIQNRMMNREGKDLLNVHVPNKKRVPFALVFHNLPELDNLSDYSIEVVSAKMD